MPKTTTIIRQDEIPGGPISAGVRRYSLEAVGEMKTDVLQAASSEGVPCVVGVSLALASSGPKIRTLALATCNQVFELALRHPPSKAQKRKLRSLFSKIQHLVGFEMPYTIILLSHTLGCDISGRDLSNVDFGSEAPDFKLRTPGTLIESLVHSGSVERINARWEKGTPSGGAKSTDTLDSNCAVRAWFYRDVSKCIPLTFIISQLSSLVPQVPFYRCYRQFGGSTQNFPAER